MPMFICSIKTTAALIPLPTVEAEYAEAAALLALGKSPQTWRSAGHPELFLMEVFRLNSDVSKRTFVVHAKDISAVFSISVLNQR